VHNVPSSFSLLQHFLFLISSPNIPTHHMEGGREESLVEELKREGVKSGRAMWVEL
jgi:hypothetical protein